MSKPGKKIGHVHIPLKRPVRGNESVTLELRCETRSGVFHVEYEGEWYQDRELENLKKRLANIVATTAEIEWARYIVVIYSATICDRRSFGQCWSHEQWGPQHNRSELDGVEDPEWRKLKKSIKDAHPARQWEDDKEPKHVLGVELEWKIEEYSAPFRRPGIGKEQMVRLVRGVDLETLVAEDRVEQTRDADLPIGAMLFSPQRLQYLEKLRAAIREIDERLSALFVGDATAISARLDARLDTRLTLAGEVDIFDDLAED